MINTSCRSRLFQEMPRGMLFGYPTSERLSDYPSVLNKRPDTRLFFVIFDNTSFLLHFLYTRVFHPTPPFATLLGFHLLIFSHTRLETVDDRYGYGTFFSPNCSTSSLRCTCLIFRFLWRGFLCHRSPLENAHHCASQPCKEQQWRNKSLSSCL